MKSAIFTTPAIAIILLSGCQAHAGPKPEPGPDYQGVKSRADAAHRGDEAAPAAAEAPRAQAPMKAAAAPKERKGAKPDWVDGESSQYPRQDYLPGVGVADDRATASDRARSEISKIFTTQVSVTTDLLEKEKTRQEGSKTETSFSQEIAQNLKTTSEKALEDVAIVELWQDPASRSHYAFAVLDRNKASAGVRERLAAFDDQARQWKADLDGAAGKLAKVKAAMKLLAVLKARSALNADLRVLEASGRGLESPVNEASAQSAASKALASLDVAVDLSGGPSSQVETGIVSGLNKFGLQAKAGSAGDIVVEGQVATVPLEIADEKWKWARTDATVSLKDGATAKTFGRFDASDRQAAVDYSQAVRRSHAELAKKTAAMVQAAITDYFENQ